MELLARTCKTEQMNFQRILARLFVILGIIFTFWMGFGAQYAYDGQPLAVATAYGLFFSGGLIITFVIGLFYENIAAVILVIGAIGVIVWGIVAQWTSGAWGAMIFLIVLPMLVSAVLYFAASRMQKICDLAGETI
jgi:hypothetical protein